MTPNSKYATIGGNIEKIKLFIDEVIIRPKHALSKWAIITNQTPAAKIGYIGQHLASLITGVPGTGSGARGDDLADGSEVKSCNKVDQADKCKDCGTRVLRLEKNCPSCGSENIARKDDSKWLFSIRDEYELNQYLNLDRIVLLLMDYPKFDMGDYRDIRISVFEIYPKENRMKVFNELIKNHYYNIFVPKQKDNQKTNPMNLHPFSFQFYKCNPIKTFECTIYEIDTNPSIVIAEDSYIYPLQNRDLSIHTIPMPTSLLKDEEWEEMLAKADFEREVEPLLDYNFLARNNLSYCTLDSFRQLSKKKKVAALPHIDMTLRDYISLRPINSVRQQEHYHRS